MLARSITKKVISAILLNIYITGSTHWVNALEHLSMEC